MTLYLKLGYGSSEEFFFGYSLLVMLRIYLGVNLRCGLCETLDIRPI